MSAARVPRPGSPALDVRNVLWLLAAMAFVVAPHIPRVPQWVGVFCLVIVAWRAWIARSALRFPPRWVVFALTLGAAAATFASYGRLLGRDAGVTLLIVMAAMKLLEMRTQREVVLAVYLGFFLVMTNFLFSQSIPLGIYLLACVWLFVATLVGFHRVGRTPTLRERLVPSGMLLLQALPLMAVFFLLFPRVQGPLWALPQDARAGITGLSESMEPGNLSQLIQSDALAFRVQFEDKMPPFQMLYWRGPVMWEFNGRTWKMSEFSPRREERPYQKAERPVKYSVTLEPHGKHWLFALDVPQPASLPPGVSMRHDLQIRSVRPVDTKVRYDMVSHLDYEFGERLPAGWKEFALRLDEDRNPRAIALGRQWRAELREPAAIVNRAFQYYNREFTYTLEPPLLAERDPYDDFLFNTKRGFCEHYAGSFAVIMRAAGIPARIVTGYQGGEVNPFNNELIVRQHDAHAWTEIWLEGKGWVRVDPTAAVSPLRVEGGVNAALGPIGAMSSFIAADRLGLLSKMRYAWQLVNSQWDQWIVGYNADRQKQFLSRLGLGAQIDWRTLAMWLVGTTFVVGGLVAVGLLLRDLPRRGEASVVAWRAFNRKLAAAGLARAPHEGPLDFLARVALARPDLEPAAAEITRRYVEARYGHGASREELRELDRRVRAFRVA
jgi:transglutaminase-like putative cysteine protease